MYLHKYVEKLASEGKISPEARAEIYRDCSALIKHANAGATTLADLPASWQMANKAIKTIAGLSAGVGMVLAPGILERGKLAGGIAANKNNLSQDPDLVKYQEKAHARLNELARVSPVIASAPVAPQLVKSRLHSGFTDSDLMTMASAQRDAMRPKEYEKIIDAADKKFKKMLSKEMKKQASAADVENARKLGELYGPCLDLIKEAGVASGMAGGLGKGIGSLMKNPEFMGNLKGMGVLMAAPVLYGAGKGALDQYLTSKENKQLREDLEKSFMTAMQKAKSDQRSNLSAHKERARDAFQTLVSISPTLARDPESTRAFLTASVNAEVGVPTDLLKNISEIERNVSQAGSYKSGPGYGPLLSGFGGGFADAGGGEIAATAIKDSTKRTTGTMFDHLSGRAEEDAQRKAEDAIDRQMSRAEKYKRVTKP